jgi:hypothetical protein
MLETGIWITRCVTDGLDKFYTIYILCTTKTGIWVGRVSLVRDNLMAVLCARLCFLA